MALKCSGVIVAKEVVTFNYTDKQTGKPAEGRRASIFVAGGGRPIEVAVDEKFVGKEGDKVDLAVYVSVYTTKAGGAAYRLIHQREK